MPHYLLRSSHRKTCCDKYKTRVQSDMVKKIEKNNACETHMKHIKHIKHRQINGSQHSK